MINLIGNDNLIAGITKAAREGKLSHAYLISGPEGSGKKTLAKILARKILCPQGGCGSCAVCCKLASGNHPDVNFIEGATKTGQLSVDQIRALRKDAPVYPNDGAKKIYVLLNAEKMQEQAQDAFLKILEEPPEFVVFILLCNDESKILSTVLSRVVRLQMRLPDTEEAVSLLRERSEAEESEIRLALKACDNVIGQADKLLSEGSLQERLQLCERFVKSVAAGNGYDAGAIIHTMNKDREAMTAFLKMLRLYCRDILVWRTSKKNELLVFEQSILRCAPAFAKLRLRGIPEYIKALSRLSMMAAGSFNINLVETAAVTFALQKLLP